MNVVFATCSRITALIVCAFLVPGTVPAATLQPGTIEGHVVTRAGAPVVGARVRAVSPSGTYGTTTDQSGHFKITGTVPAAYVVSIVASKFDPVRLAGVTVLPGATAEQLVRLAPHTDGVSGMLNVPGFATNEGTRIRLIDGISPLPGTSNHAGPGSKVLLPSPPPSGT